MTFNNTYIVDVYVKQVTYLFSEKIEIHLTLQDGWFSVVILMRSNAEFSVNYASEK